MGTLSRKMIVGGRGTTNDASSDLQDSRGYDCCSLFKPIQRNFNKVSGGKGFTESVSVTGVGNLTRKGNAG